MNNEKKNIENISNRSPICIVNPVQQLLATFLLMYMADIQLFCFIVIIARRGQDLHFQIVILLVVT